MKEANKDNENQCTVAESVLATFVDDVASENDLTEVAERLRQVLLDSKTVNEATLRRALFGELRV